MTKFFKSFLADESGAVASEYAVLLVLIAAAIIVAVLALSAAISGGMNRVATCLTSLGATC